MVGAAPEDEVDRLPPSGIAPRRPRCQPPSARRPTRRVPGPNCWRVDGSPGCSLVGAVVGSWIVCQQAARWQFAPSLRLVRRSRCGRTSGTDRARRRSRRRSGWWGIAGGGVARCGVVRAGAGAPGWCRSPVPGPVVAEVRRCRSGVREAVIGVASRVAGARGEREGEKQQEGSGRAAEAAPGTPAASAKIEKRASKSLCARGDAPRGAPVTAGPSVAASARRRSAAGEGATRRPRAGPHHRRGRRALAAREADARAGGWPDVERRPTGGAPPLARVGRGPWRQVAGGYPPVVHDALSSSTSGVPALMRGQPAASSRLAIRPLPARQEAPSRPELFPLPGLEARPTQAADDRGHLPTRAGGA